MFKKRLGIILMLVCILTTTATEAFAAASRQPTPALASRCSPIPPRQSL